MGCKRNAEKFLVDGKIEDSITEAQKLSEPEKSRMLLKIIKKLAVSGKVDLAIEKAKLLDLNLTEDDFCKMVLGNTSFE